MDSQGNGFDFYEESEIIKIDKRSVSYNWLLKNSTAQNIILQPLIFQLISYDSILSL